MIVLSNSNRELSLSKTESLAREISSSNKIPPFLQALTKVPSSQINYFYDFS
jgi:hypothetical protein